MFGHQRTIGRYRLLDELGSGGFATVYRAHDPALARDVAIKVLHPHLARDAAIRERFVREGRALARVRHPNVVAVFDAGESSDTAYLAMELIGGDSLAHLIRDDGPLPLTRVSDIAEQVASALDAIHARGLLHLDVKPANVLVEAESGRAVLLDLGISRSIDGTTVGHTGSLLGTPAYLAPEQLEEDARVGPFTDIYQLGATVYALLAGQPPFTGEPARVLTAILRGTPPSLHTVRPDIAAHVSAAVGRAMAHRPTERPATASAFAARLALPDEGSDRVPAQLLPPTDATVEIAPPLRAPQPSAAPAPADEQTQRHVQPLPQADRRRADRPSAGREPPRAAWSGRQRLVATVAAVVVVLVGLGGVAYALSNRDSAGTTTAGVPGGLAGSVSSAQPPQARVPEPTPALQSSPAPAPVAVPTPAAPASATPEPTPRPPPPPTAAPTPRATAAPTPALEPVSGGRTASALAAAMVQRGYAPQGEPIQTRATPAGGTLAVQRGVCRDAADGLCQLLFIVIDDRFIGTDWPEPSRAITALSPAGVGRFQATYAAYAEGDAACCPSRAPVTVTFTWDGARLRPDVVAPGQCTRGC